MSPPSLQKTNQGQRALLIRRLACFTGIYQPLGKPAHPLSTSCRSWHAAASKTASAIQAPAYRPPCRQPCVHSLLLLRTTPGSFVSLDDIIGSQPFFLGLNSVQVGQLQSFASFTPDPTKLTWGKSHDIDASIIHTVAKSDYKGTR
jgi:hypothetical protein